MFTKLSTMTIGLNYGAPAGDMNGKPISLEVANRAIYEACKDFGIDCYTVIQCKGYWNGQPEDSLRVEVCHNEGHKDVVKAARQIKVQLRQEAVLVTLHEVNSDLV